MVMQYSLPNSKTLFSDYLIDLKKEAAELKQIVGRAKSNIQEKYEQFKENLPYDTLAKINLGSVLSGFCLVIGGGALEVLEKLGYTQINGLPYVVAGAAVVGTSAFVAVGLAKTKLRNKVD